MRAKKEEMPVVLQEGAAVSRIVEQGDMHVAYEAYPAGFDPSPFLKGLPDDRCQCRHWGYVFKGRLRVSYGEREEVLTAGDVYYIPPGHLAVYEEDSEIVELSPKGEMEKTVAVVMRNVAAAEGGAS